MKQEFIDALEHAIEFSRRKEKIKGTEWHDEFVSIQFNFGENMPKWDCIISVEWNDWSNYERSYVIQFRKWYPRLRKYSLCETIRCQDEYHVNEMFASSQRKELRRKLKKIIMFAKNERS